MSFQSKTINVASFAIGLTSVFVGSKYVESSILTKSNEKFINNINSLSSEAKQRWNHKLFFLKSKIENLDNLIKTMKSSETQRVHDELEEERKMLQNLYIIKTEQKKKELENDLIDFQRNMDDKIKAYEDVITKIESRLYDYVIAKNKQKNLEKISQMIVEDNIDGEFNNFYSLKRLRIEFKELLPVARQYDLFDYFKMSLIKYSFSYAISKLLFPSSSIQRFDLLAELNSCVERGDLHRSLFLFNHLKGWPRLILKDWAERCRMRLEFVQEIKSQIYLNKI